MKRQYIHVSTAAVKTSSCSVKRCLCATSICLVKNFFFLPAADERGDGAKTAPNAAETRLTDGHQAAGEGQEEEQQQF